LRGGAEPVVPVGVSTRAGARPWRCQAPPGTAARCRLGSA
jgi:hypothetical protein